jgi:hypothetical protein
MALFPRGAALAAVVLMSCAAGTAHAAPLIDSTLLKGGAVAGRTVELQVRASDRTAPVTGLVVGFGSGESGYGLSNCLPPDYRGRSFGPVAAPGRRVTLTAPHQYSTPGRRSLVATVISGGCAPGQASAAQGIQVQVVRPGESPQPIVTTPPVVVPVGQLLPDLPGLGELPTGSVTIPSVQVPVPGVPATPPIQVQLPGLPGLPTLPGLPALPGLPGLPRAGVAKACPDRHRWFSRRRKGERRTKAALLCLLNAERRRRGLRPLRANARLARAARAHSRSMVRRRYFAHVGPGNTNPTKRLYAARYLPGGGRWAVGENIGFGTGAMTRPISIHQAWMRSTPHRAAMLSRKFREVGFGIYPGIPFQNRGATFTADFAATR